MYTKFPVIMMVLKVMSNKRNVIPPHFFLQDLRINTADYKKVLEMVVRPWIESVTIGKHLSIRLHHLIKSRQHKNE